MYRTGLFTRMNQRAISWDTIFGEGSAGTKTHSGTIVSEESSLKYSTVWACATLIADSVSSVHPEAFIVVEDTTGERKETPVPSWIVRPHPSLRRDIVWNQMMLSALLWGNAYALLVRRDSDQMIVAMYPLNPADVQCEWDPNKSGYRRYKILNGPWLSEGDIFHVQGPTLPGQATGLSVIGQARESIGLGLTMEEFGSRYFSQGSVAKTVITTSKTLDEQGARRLVRQYEMFHRGPGNWHRPAVLAGPGVKMENISIAPEDAQFLQTREFQAMEIGRWFRVPPHRLGIVTKQSSWGSGLMAENTSWVQNTLRPWLTRFEDAFTAYTPYGEGRGVQVRLNTSDLLRGSWKEMVEAWGLAVEKQLATPNEGRKALGLPPIDGGDDLVKPQPKPGPKAEGSGAVPPFPKTRAMEKRAELKGKWVVVVEPNACAVCAGNTDPKVVPLHPNCRCTREYVDAFGNPVDISLDDAFNVPAYLTEATRAEVEAFLIKNNLSLDKMVDEIATNGAQFLEAGSKWYPEAYRLARILAVEADVSIQQAAATLSAISPRTFWSTNVKAGEKLIHHFKEFANMTPEEASKAIGSLGGVLKANAAVAFRILRGADIHDTLTGPKRQSFYNNILLPERTGDVTVDGWMAQVMCRVNPDIGPKDAQKLLSNHGNTSPKWMAAYTVISEATRLAAARLGVSPDAMQAAYWIYVRGGAG